MKSVRTIAAVTLLLLTSVAAFYAYFVVREGQKPRPLFHDRWTIAGGSIVPRWQLLQPHFIGENVILADPQINLLAVIDVSGKENGTSVLDFRFDLDSATVVVEGQMSATIAKQLNALIVVDSHGKIVTVDIEPGVANEIFLKSKSLPREHVTDLIDEIVGRNLNRRNDERRKEE